MKRRTFGLLTGTSLIALTGQCGSAQAADPGLLKTTLTPMGAERAGNADGSIPAWTGGATTIPAGWTPGQEMPAFFADEQPIVVIDASNMAQHQDRLSAGVMQMMTQLGYSIKVYPTHRTAAAPQYVYDNIVSNLSTAKLNPEGGRLGFTGGYGGVPFAIPDLSDPLAAGAQIVWNHICRWQGFQTTQYSAGYVVESGQLNLSGGSVIETKFHYYDPNGSLAGYDGRLEVINAYTYAPASQQGGDVVAWYHTNPYAQPNILWELLNGQGRVRKAPELSYDTPSSFADGVSSYEQNFGFNGALDRYDWTYIGKKEMYIPYNNNGLRLTPAQVAHQAKFLNPDSVRWELHRCWVVDAKLHPGQRNTLVHRLLYIDEDTWMCGVIDDRDANGNIYTVDLVFNQLRPDLPGLIYLNSVTQNLQTGSYVTIAGPWGNAPYSKPLSFKDLPEKAFDPQVMAASASY